MPGANTFDRTDDLSARSLQRESLARVPTYAEAQHIVDKLADAEFDVSAVQIVGSGLKSVEQVTGRLTTARAASFGAAAGGWWGAFVGLLLGLFAAAWLAPLLVGALIGAAFGAVFGAVAHAALGGRRDFTSVQTVSASQYEVLVLGDKAVEARRLLDR